MEMSSTRIVNAAPAAAWAALNDPAILKACIPGCETFERVSDTEWRVVVAAKVGPVSARFTGRVQLADLDPPHAYTLKFEGQGGAAGFANGEARVALTPSDAGATALAYTAKAQIGGKLAQIGSRLIDGVAAKMADDFFDRFSRQVAPPPAPAPGEAAPHEGAPAARRGGGAYVRYIAMAAIAVLLTWLAFKGVRR
jgi:carbon monoxide dehydrogenase subunit G